MKIKIRTWDSHVKAWVNSRFVVNNHVFPQMLWTGLKDTNGKEIYEGDVVKVEQTWYNDDSEITGHGSFTGVVRLMASRGATVYTASKEYKNLPGYRSEVIGNIYQNPELIPKRSASTP